MLIGNTFPLSLIRRNVLIFTRTQSELRMAITNMGGVVSFWGHANTVTTASEWAGVDLSPRVARPALTLDQQGFPTLNGQSFTRCWVLSPDYAPGFRPKEGELVPAEAILGWQALEIVWETPAQDFPSDKPCT